MASNYPASLDTTATLPAAGSVGANLSTFPHSTLHGNADDAIIAIETELGVAPSGAEATVKARLDRITPTLGPFTTWTPAIVQLGAVTTTNTTSAYIRIGRLIMAKFNVAVTGSGTAANSVTISLPVTASSSTDVMGFAYIIDTSAGSWLGGGLRAASTTTATIMAISGTTPQTSNSALGSAVFTAALASGDLISGWMWYEAAAD